MELKKSLILPLVSLIFIFGFFGVVGAATGITVTFPNGGENVNDGVTITWTVTGSQTSDRFDVRYSPNNGLSWVSIVETLFHTTRSHSWDTTSVSDGTNYLIQVVETGSSSGAPDDVSDSVFTVDNNAPTSSADTLGNFQNTVTFDVPYTATDLASGVDEVELFYNKDGAGWISYGTFSSSPISFISIGDGTYEFYTIATDNAGNVESKAASAEASTIVDTIDPTITDDYTSDGIWVNSAQTVTLSPSDTNGIFSVLTCEGTGCTPDTLLAGPPYQLSFSTSQDTIVRYQATDNAGNPSLIDEFNVKLDIDNPTASVGGAPSGLIVDASGVTATISCDDSLSGCNEIKYKVETTSTCSSNSAEYTPGTSVLVTDHSWVCAYATDNAGNEDFSDPVEFNIFSTIQSAIDAANSGDTINVAAGTYNEQITIDKSLTLSGDVGDDSAGPGINAPMLDGQSILNDAFTILAGVSEVTIEGFEIMNYVGSSSGVGNAVQAWNSGTSNIVIRDNHMHDLDWNGVLVGNDGALGDHDNWVIKNNILENYGAYGLELTNARNSVIEDNIVTASNSWTGILVVARRTEMNITIQNNEISGTIENDTLAGGRAAMYILAWDAGEGFSNPNLDDILVQNNRISTISTKPHIRTRDVGGTVTGIVVNNNILSSLTNDAAAQVNAEDNWWGDLNPSDQVIGDVDFTPWAYNSNVDTDHDAPTSTINSPAEFSWQNSDFNAELGYSDTGGAGLENCKYKVESNGVITEFYKSAGTCSGNNEIISKLITVGSGLNCRDEGTNICEVFVKAFDNSGNGGAEVSRMFSIDFTDPIVTVDSVITPTNIATQTITGTFTETNIETIIVNGDSATIIGSTYSAANVPLVEGPNTITVVATDLAGNSVTDNSASITLDTLLPEITGLNNFGVEIDSSISVTATVTDLNGIDNVVLHYTIEGESELTASMTPSGDDYTGSIPSQSSSTTISYFVVAQDNAGNTQTSSTFTITVNDLIWVLDSTWNLVSVPKTLGNKGISSLLPGSGIFRYNTRIVSWEQGSVDFSELNPGEGYWVDDGGNAEVGLDYAEDCTGPECFPSETIILEQGWNLIGHMCTNAQNVEVAVPPETYDNLFVLRFNEISGPDGSFEIYSTEDPTNRQFEEMVPGEGYWVFVPEGDLAYTNTC